VAGVGSDRRAGTSVAVVVGGGPTGGLVVSRLFLFVIATEVRKWSELESVPPVPHRSTSLLLQLPMACSTFRARSNFDPNVELYIRAK